MERTIIEAHGLVKTYGAGPRALDGVDLEIRRGTRFSLLGPNGAGKSTLTRVLCTLSRPDEGTVLLDGLPLDREGSRIRTRIGVALQDLQVDPRETVRSQLRFQCRLYGMDAREATDRTDELLARFGLDGSADRKAGELSGGTRRRLHVASALAHRPDILFLDEPTVGMDAEIRGLFWDELERVNREEGVTLFFTTQYLEEASRHSVDLAILDGGRVAFRGTMADFLASGRRSPDGGLEEAYLGFLQSRRSEEGKAVLHA